MHKDLESIQQARDLAEAAHAAFLKFEHFTAEQVENILKALSETGIAHAAQLAKMAVDETGYGNAEHKTLKNLFCARDVYNAIRPMKTVGIVHEDAEKKILEVASPIGVIAAIIPSTNPTSTTIYKALIALKGRNAIVFSPHPSAAKCILETSRLLADAAERAGAPRGVISCMTSSTLEGTDTLMKHPRTALILATGGSAMVKAAYSAGKPAFGVGPGNVPTYIDRTADVPKAVRDILTGKTFDNGTLCSSEQSIVCDETVKDAVLAELRRQGAYLCSPAEKASLEKVIQTPRRTLNTKIVGQSADRIAKMAGFSVPEGTRAIVAHAEGVGMDHPISMEKLSPLLGFFTVRDWREGCERCIEILKFGGLGHTLSLHCGDDKIVREFGLRKPAFRICVNTPAALGAVGYTTNLFPAMTLGCGAQGNNVTSDNISPLHLINLKRVAYGVRDVAATPVIPPVSPMARAMPESVKAVKTSNKRAVVENVVDQWLGKKSTSAAFSPFIPASDVKPLVKHASAAPQQPPLSSYRELQPGAPKPAAAAVATKPVPFVCEDDVRTAIRSHARILIGKKTIITPSARDLGEGSQVFVVSD
jgi:acetaldehyde dehydrogenase (acetylating)